MKECCVVDAGIEGVKRVMAIRCFDCNRGNNGV